MRSLAEEVVSIARSELPGLEAAIGYLDGHDSDVSPAADAGGVGWAGDAAEFPALPRVLARVARLRVERYEFATAAGREVAPPSGPDAVVVPLLASPDGALTGRIRQAVAESGATAELTDVLGPHPLLAEALHVRLSEAGLSRADRARLFTVTSAADGIVLATAGGAEAVQAAGITGMLLAARLAVPVIAAALDEEGSVAAVAEQLRASGSQALALAPYLIGPELAEGALEAAAAAAGCSVAEPLGAYPAVGKLVLSQYAAALGITPQPQGAPVR